MITLLISIALAGLVVWAITTYIPMPAPFKMAILVIAGICLLLYLLTFFGLWDSGDAWLPRHHGHR